MSTPKLLLALLCLIFSINVLIYLHSFMYLSPTMPWLHKVNYENSLRYDTYYKSRSNVIRRNLKSSSLHPSLRDTLDLYERLIQSYTPENAELGYLTTKCRDRSEFELINDEECRAWWMAVLAKEEIVDVGISLGFLRSEHKLGAVQVIFKNGMKGWYKPCGLHSEYPENEVIAGVIDFLMGFNRAPPSVMRNITSDYLVSVVKKNSHFYPLDSRYYVLDQIFATCSDNGMLNGAITAWWNGIEDGISLPKTLKYMEQYFPDSTIQEERRKLPNHENAEQIHSHILVYLLNILRVPGKNEFVSYQGNQKYYLGIDLDRTNLLSDIKEIPTFCEGCLIGNQTLANLKKIYHNYDDFSIEIMHTWDVLGGFTLQQKHLDGLYKRLRYIVNCFDTCMAQTSPSSVIIPDEVWNVKNKFTT
uniref:Uncharacterized protein n=1 Tax=Vannella robusta TaxID=1487602 RepID=A0A7S4HII3_9EUKA